MLVDSNIKIEKIKKDEENKNLNQKILMLKKKINEIDTKKYGNVDKNKQIFPNRISISSLNKTNFSFFYKKLKKHPNSCFF